MLYLRYNSPMMTKGESPTLEEWLTTTQAAELAGYHVEYVRRLMREGTVEGRKWWNTWQVNRDSFLAYLERIENQGERRGPKKDTA